MNDFIKMNRRLKLAATVAISVVIVASYQRRKNRRILPLVTAPKPKSNHAHWKKQLSEFCSAPRIVEQITCALPSDLNNLIAQYTTILPLKMTCIPPSRFVIEINSKQWDIKLNCKDEEVKFIHSHDHGRIEHLKFVCQLSTSVSEALLLIFNANANASDQVKVKDAAYEVLCTRCDIMPPLLIRGGTSDRIFHFNPMWMETFM
jgi:hypothetical protein